MNKKTGIQITAPEKGELTKAQKQFNRLSKQVDNLNKRIVSEQEILGQIMKMYMGEMLPILEEEALLRQKVIIALDKALEQYPFSKKDKQLGEDVILFFVDKVLESDIEPSEEVKAIIDKYSDESYDDIAEGNNEASRDMFIAMAKEMMGIDIDNEKLKNVKINSIEDILLFLNDNHADEITQNLFDRAEQTSATKTNAKDRKKTKKQLEKEQLEKDKEEFKKKNIRSIYLSLAKMLHPDTALTDEGRTEKESQMKEVTKAYDNQDFAMLIALESKWIHNTTAHLSQINENVLDLYCEVLKDQITDLKAEVEMQKMHPRFMPIQHLHVCRFPKKGSVRELKKGITEAKKQLLMQKEDLETLNTKNNVLGFIYSMQGTLEMQKLSFNPFDFLDDF